MLISSMENKPKRIFPSKDELISNREFFKYKRLKYRGENMVFDKDVRTGTCSFCQKSAKNGEISKTSLHHLKYDDLDPLAWTIEVCPSCHYKVDEKNKTKINMYYDRKSDVFNQS